MQPHGKSLVIVRLHVFQWPRPLLHFMKFAPKYEEEIGTGGQNKISHSQAHINNTPGHFAPELWNHGM